MLLRFVSKNHSPLLHYFTYINILYTCSFKLTQSQYAHKAVVETMGNQIQLFNERHLTHISQALSYYTVTIGIGYHVNRHIPTGIKPFEEYFEE